jgi:hypothetical protein
MEKKWGKPFLKSGLIDAGYPGKCDVFEAILRSYIRQS